MNVIVWVNNNYDAATGIGEVWIEALTDGAGHGGQCQYGKQTLFKSTTPGVWSLTAATALAAIRTAAVALYLALEGITITSAGVVVNGGPQ